MAMINIVTGHTGVDHVTSDDDRHFNAAIVGNGDFILKGGNGWEPSIIGANSVRVASGEASVQGCHIRSTEPVELVLEVGTSGYKRNDLIGIRYLNAGGIESAELTVVKGVPTTGTPVDPSYIAEDILNGGEERFAPLIRAVFNGTAIESVTRVCATSNTLEEDQVYYTYGVTNANGLFRIRKPDPHSTPIAAISTTNQYLVNLMYNEVGSDYAWVRCTTWSGGSIGAGYTIGLYVLYAHYRGNDLAPV